MSLEISNEGEKSEVSSRGSFETFSRRAFSVAEALRLIRFISAEKKETIGLFPDIILTFFVKKVFRNKSRKNDNRIS